MTEREIERERLIELIKTVNNMRTMRSSIEECVDYLLANGVIAPPYNVGDTVYVNPETWSCLSFIEYDHCFIQSKHFLVAEVVSIIKTRKQNLFKLKVHNRTTCTPEYERYSISSIGKTVFLTRKEAEKALKERGN